MTAGAWGPGQQTPTPTPLPRSGGSGRLSRRCDLRPGAEVAHLDHCNIRTPDVPAAHAHQKSLGFGCSETIEGDEHELYAAWMYGRQIVQSVAFTGGAGPRSHHLGAATHESHQVLGRADLCTAA
ncbi:MULTISPECIES: hypothetical protein [Streptomyces]|uniref:Uncharacterized protein n=1 Tax=Streptomyces flaveolus TaxID=67297 RepID=A0ABV3A9S4_9ACTN|nr:MULTISPECIES: hypothetical protein [Streptomyces]